ncbi:hypothetical protein [Streptomyces sp. NBC_00096]|uniref:hypothetical protein n=1 Tax=Streptomyces sp. NBC_00096 TaxID=2975650 RepID=UPI003254D2D8
MRLFPFPDDLIALQHEWTAAYRLLAGRPRLGTAALRRRLIELSCRINVHPYWEGSGWSTAGRVELRRAAEAAAGLGGAGRGGADRAVGGGFAETGSQVGSR